MEQDCVRGVSMVTKMIYSSVATPPDGVVLTNRYTLEKDSKGYFYCIGKEKVYQDIELIKALFSPIERTWDEVLKPSSKKIASKKEEN